MSDSTVMLSDAEYVDASGLTCPHCKSTNISTHGTFDPETATIEVVCDDCDRRWYDCYKLAGWMPN